MYQDRMFRPGLLGRRSNNDLRVQKRIRLLQAGAMRASSKWRMWVHTNSRTDSVLEAARAIAQLFMSSIAWQQNLVDDVAGLRGLLAATKSIAVLGIKTEAQSYQPAFYVPKYLQAAGFQIIPVPVYYPEVTQILGQPVYRSLQEIPFRVDLVNIFRRPRDLEPHVDDILACGPKAVWMQSGIRHEPIAETLAKAGIKVVQDRCLMVDHRYLAS